MELNNNSILDGTLETYQNEHPHSLPWSPVVVAIPELNLLHWAARIRIPWDKSQAKEGIEETIHIFFQDPDVQAEIPDTPMESYVKHLCTPGRFEGIPSISQDESVVQIFKNITSTEQFADLFYNRIEAIHPQVRETYRSLPFLQRWSSQVRVWRHLQKCSDKHNMLMLVEKNRVKLQSGSMQTEDIFDKFPDNKFMLAVARLVEQGKAIAFRFNTKVTGLESESSDGETVVAHTEQMLHPCACNDFTKFPQFGTEYNRELLNNVLVHAQYVERYLPVVGGL